MDRSEKMPGPGQGQRKPEEVRAPRPLCFMIGCLLLICAFVFEGAAQQQAGRRQNIRISAVQARLFYNDTGAFSENVLTGKVDLWNSPFDSAYATLVTVEIEGLPTYLDPVVRVELAARYVPFDREKGSLAVRQIETIRNGSENGKAYAPFWLKRTGCNPVYLAARIVGRGLRGASWVKAKINFGCGE